jgi:hypothetical protein
MDASYEPEFQSASSRFGNPEILFREFECFDSFAAASSRPSVGLLLPVLMVAFVSNPGGKKAVIPQETTLPGKKSSCV